MHEYLNQTPFLKVSGEIQVSCGTYYTPRREWMKSCCLLSQTQIWRVQ